MNAPQHGVVAALRNVSERSSGALVRRRRDGSTAGAILAEAGRVCWARSAGQRARMTDLLLAQSQERLSRDALERAVRACRDSQGPLGEYLVRSGLVSAVALRGALLRHTCEAIVDLVAEEESWEWVEHRGKGYSPALTFSPADVFSGLHALETPNAVDDLRQLLGACTLSGQRAFAIARDLSDRTPVAHVGCDEFGVDALYDLAEQAYELMTLGSLVLARGIVYVSEQFACAAWLGGSYLHVIVDSDELAFNRLVSQLAAINP